MSNVIPLPAQTARTDPGDLDSLADAITELAAHIHAVTWHLLVMIREFDQRAGWSGPGMKSCAHWLNW